MDNTNKVGHETMIMEKNRVHMKIMKGGVLSVINERSEIIAWVCTLIDHGSLPYLMMPQCFCQSASLAEATEILERIRNQCRELGIPYPELAVVDNCCTVHAFINVSLPDLEVVLDVWHF